MLMMSLMVEEKQLDLNRPLISVRRPIQTSEPNSKPGSVTNKILPSPPVYKSDINSGPVRNPGTVPFQWEHKPGKPKDERKHELQSVVEPRFVPKLPPGRTVKVRERGVSVRKHGTRANHEEDATEKLSRFLPQHMASDVCGLVPQVCSFGVLNPVPSVRVHAQRGVSVRRMRSKYQDSTTPCNGSLAQGSSQDESLSVSSTPQGKEKTSRKPLSEAHVVEKTLYVDTVHSVDKKVQEESNEKSLDVVLVKEDVQNLIGASEEAFSSLKVEECADQAIVALPESNVVVKITKEKIDLERTRLHHGSAYHIVQPPPLPKAPSDSWLKRTLPTISSKNNSFTWLQPISTKWETLVKTSNTQQGFVCFSKETLNPIPEA